MGIFDNLNKEEIAKLYDAPALVTILIGAADDQLDGEERSWSERLLRARSYSGEKELQDFYRVVAEGFWVKIQHEMSALPAEIAARNGVISTRLESLNNILAKLTPAIAFALYKGLVGLAEETAKASGGFLRIGAVSAAEHDWVKLSMITPVADPHVHEKKVDDFDTNIWGEQKGE